mmetsp:Transcript_43672/g.100782  ORF Transcript_43672/g.100782 Transcript_43672/m.100782 type:complete len:193 (+) Transcript_43672:116-694(+)
MWPDMTYSLEVRSIPLRSVLQEVGLPHDALACESTDSTPLSAGYYLGSQNFEDGPRSDQYSNGNTVTSSSGTDDGARDRMLKARRQQFHRTRFCTFYQQGRCLRGEKCTFAHSGVEVRSMPNLRKTTLCQAWVWGRSCPLDKEQCDFAHGRADLRTTDGFWKTSLCKMHSRGRCQQGNKCRYAHSLDELRTE